MDELIVSMEGSMNLSEGEQTGILISQEDIAELSLKSDGCLIGRLMFDRRIRKEAFCTLMARLWKMEGEVIFKELYDNTWLLEFSTITDKKRVQEGSPWLFDRSVLVLKELEENISPLQMDFSISPFWIQIHDLPFGCMTREVGLKIGASIGRVEDVRVPGDGESWSRGLRVRVQVDITKPLERGRVLKLNGKQAWVAFRYEKLPHFCFHCGRILHNKMPCSGSQGVRGWRGGGKSEVKLSQLEREAPGGGKVVEGRNSDIREDELSPEKQGSVRTESTSILGSVDVNRIFRSNFNEEVGKDKSKDGGQFPETVGLQGDISQGEKGEEPGMVQEERSRQDVSEIKFQEGKVQSHGSTPKENSTGLLTSPSEEFSIGLLTSPSEEMENVLETNKDSEAPRKWTRRERNLNPSQHKIQMGKRRHDEVAEEEGVSSNLHVKKGRKEAEVPTDEFKAVAGSQPRQSQ
ncbi:uncharacterized protein LOC133860261 [Alnus glutinosa]|uniref:uncharacterized protein LOC133860261 n=1 Tax=Alnus glutinosa TaxID=3517 RepID=UPI002D769CD1|nr:uncharacterized protein LOC133860261 [Alnus glutinosa]